MFAQTPIGTLGGNASRAAGIGPQGEVVGFADDAAGVTHAMFVDGNGMHDLGFLPVPNPPQTVNVSGAAALGLSPQGSLTAVGGSGFIPVMGMPFVPAFEQAFLHVVGGAGMQFAGTFIPGPLPGTFLGNSRANAMNGKGQIVGVSDVMLTGSPRQAFLLDLNFSPPSFTNIGTLDIDPSTGMFRGNSEAFGINDNGQIVGTSDTGSMGPNGIPIQHAFLFDIASQQMTDLGTLLEVKLGPSPARGMSVARAINNRGQVVGISDSFDHTQQLQVTRGFLWDPWVVGVRFLRDLGTFDLNGAGFYHDAGNSEAYGINNNGDIVGMAWTGQTDPFGGPERRAFKTAVGSGTLQDLHAAALINPGNLFIEATGINDAGQICGNVQGAAGSSGLLLTPVP